MPEVLLVDKRATMGVDICRIVGKQGCRVTVFAERGSLAMRSRFCHHKVASPSFGDEEAYCNALNHLLSVKRYDAIHVCHEEVLARMLSSLGNAQWNALLVPPLDRLRTALSKNAMLTLVAQAGVAAPSTVIPDDESDIRAAVNEFGLPLIIKGDTGESGENVRLIHDASAAVKAYREISTRETRAESRPAIQQFIRGPAYSIGGLFREGHALRVVAHRKLIRYPYPWGGRTVKGVTEHNSELLRAAFEVFGALEYTGLGHTEFIQDARDGQFKFLEINPRLWGTIAVASYAGVDLFTPYRRLVEGLPVAADLRYKAGVVFHRTLREARLVRQRPQRLFGLIRDFLDPRVHSDIMWTDPGPHLPSLSQVRRLIGQKDPAMPRLS